MVQVRDLTSVSAQKQGRCPHCNNVIASNQSSCPSCGKSLIEEVYLCPKCNNEVSDKATVCPHCGAKFTPEGDTAHLENARFGESLPGDVEWGTSYIVEEEGSEKSYEIFINLIERLKNSPGLCITKTNPKKLKRITKMDVIEVHWLTKTQTKENTLDPERLDFEVMNTLSEFLKEAKNRIVILD